MNQQINSKKVQALRKAVKVANDLRHKKPSPFPPEWEIIEKILKGCKKRLATSFTKENVLKACILLNALWSTRIPPPNVTKWATILTKFLNKEWKELSRKPAEEKRRCVAKELMLEGMNKEETKKKKQEIPIPSQRIQRSFLSKFFHLLVEGGEKVFPLYDRFAKKAATRIVQSIPELKKNVGRKNGLGDYEWHAKKVLVICKKLSSDDKPVGFRELDYLLWLAGQYYEYKKDKEKGKDSRLSKFVIDFLNKPISRTLKDCLDALDDPPSNRGGFSKPAL